MSNDNEQEPTAQKGTQLKLRDLLLLLCLLILVGSVMFMMGNKLTIKEIERRMIENPLFCLQVQQELYEMNNSVGRMPYDFMNTNITNQT